MQIKIPRLVILAVFLVSVSFLAIPISARAEVYQGPGVTPKGEFSAGGFAELIFEGSAFNVIAQGTYGLGDSLQVEGRVGGGSSGGYLGGFLKSHLASGNWGDFSAWGGFHLYTNSVFTFDVAPLYGLPVKSVDLYVALPLWLGVSGTNAVGFTLNPGGSYPIRPHMRIYGEFQLRMLNAFNSLSVGLRYFF